jgi:hypothetical protein
MNNPEQLNYNRNELNNTPEQKKSDQVNILSLLEEGNLQKQFFSGQITIEEYQKRKNMLKII